MGNLHISQLQDMTISGLTRMAKEMMLSGYSGLRKQELIARILEAKAKLDEGTLYGGGVLEVLPEGYGFLRSSRFNYLQSSEDIYLSHSQQRKFGLRTGHFVEGTIRPPKKTDGQWRVSKHYQR